MNDFRFLQVECQQMYRDLAEHFMDEFIECFAHRQNDEYGADIDDDSGRMGDTQALLLRPERVSEKIFK